MAPYQGYSIGSNFPTEENLANEGKEKRSSRGRKAIDNYFHLPAILLGFKFCISFKERAMQCRFFKTR
jgi:hypothetical protein